jgi:hypothetical protein
VLASPTSAKSHYVNEEIRLFKSRHAERPVIPVILDGTPGHPELESFAPALRFDLAADGTVTASPTEVLAADNAGWQRDLSIAHDKAGDVLVAQGDLAAALERFTAALPRRPALKQGDHRDST